ncbi:hypothetical protein CON65_17510 [Bacillus pseudomycoides]|uniref:Uncharacterized protein n=1 Tax=Bacillus pseudomycoides TaxID=64104 RepID=A0AA91VB62_9BACI|nr:hypothetical protein COO03_07165 [Bacillus sp. AFS098217]PED81393.1 hypothetical protein CON65_17510 [Bacillus pseudomycoides]PEU06346.1 hypothetical protein CN524_23895 [Bacillus sp. AFS019443]PEU13309.1 hypothetical protein CN525_19790 [Bacillus sp. AFS014408]PFW64153.1 hypothetical protein COL20_06040 [Bacillus sp. AFS075034]
MPKLINFSVFINFGCFRIETELSYVQTCMYEELSTKKRYHAYYDIPFLAFFLLAPFSVSLFL